MGSFGSTSILDSTFNTRFLPAGNKKFLRSDCPTVLTRKEIKWLKDHNIVTIVDLRQPEECELKPCCLEKEKGFKYLHLPVTGGWDIPSPPTVEHIIETYKEMTNENTFSIADAIMSSPTNVMYFCAAGKDRTGVVSAIILHRLGVNEETIVKDYLESTINSLAYAKYYMETYHPEQELKPLLSDERYIKAALVIIKEQR